MGGAPDGRADAGKTASFSLFSLTVEVHVPASAVLAGGLLHEATRIVYEASRIAVCALRVAQCAFLCVVRIGRTGARCCRRSRQRRTERRAPVFGIVDR